jgi:hypothetical protein
MSINNTTLFGILIVPAIVGLVEVAKDVGLPSKMAPAAAVLFGILAALAALYQTRWPWIQAVTIGVALGLSAVGLYSGASTILPDLLKSQTTSAHTNGSGATIGPGVQPKTED